MLSVPSKAQRAETQGSAASRGFWRKAPRRATRNELGDILFLFEVQKTGLRICESRAELRLVPRASDTKPFPLILGSVPEKIPGLSLNSGRKTPVLQKWFQGTKGWESEHNQCTLSQDSGLFFARPPSSLSVCVCVWGGVLAPNSEPSPVCHVCIKTHKGQWVGSNIEALIFLNQGIRKGRRDRPEL